MGKHSQFPWDLLKAECLRLVCSQLVQASNESISSYPGGGRKEDMIEFLRDVETRTLDAAVETLQAKSTPRKTTGTAEPSSPGKRPRAEEENASDEDPEGYNTRFKGVKRVKVREEPRQSESEPKHSPRKSVTAAATSGTPVKRGRGRPRKSVPAEGTTSAPAGSDEAGENEKVEGKEGETSETGAKEEGETSKAGAETTATDAEAKDAEAATKDEVATPKRGRGRPRKSESKPQEEATPKPKAAPKPSAAPKPKAEPALDAEGKPKRGRGRPRKSVPDAASAPAPVSKSKEVFDGVHLQTRKTDPKGDPADPNADGEGEEEDAVLAAVNGQDALGDGASSLGASNKENEPEEFRYNNTTTTEAVDHDVDMDADGDPDGEAEQTNAAPAPVAAA